MKKKILCMGMVCVILLGILCGCGEGTTSGGGCKTSDELIEQFVEAFCKDTDAKKLLGLYDADVKGAIVDIAKDHDIYGEDEIEARYQDTIDMSQSNRDEIIEGKWKYTIDIEDEYQYITDSENPEYDIRSFNQNYRSKGLENFTAEEAKEIYFYVKFLNSDGNPVTYTLSGDTFEFRYSFRVDVAKIDGKWYLTSDDIPFYDDDFTKIDTYWKRF